jgi:hypothetical protein
MSVFSHYAGIRTSAPVTGQSPIEEFYAKWMVAAAVFFVVLEIAYLVVAGLPPLGKPWVDGTNFVYGRDFLNTWMGGRSTFSGGPAALFDVRVYNDALRQMLGTAYQEHYWSYPPHLMLFIWPLGLMPYLPAYVAWCVVGIALYLFACSAAIPRRHMLFLAVAPGVAVCIFFGQNGFYTAALLIGGLLNLDRRPVLAGVLFGILTVKPQLGMLLPVILLLERRWLTIAAAVATTAVLVAATSMLFGLSIWFEFWQKIVPQQQWLTENGGGLLFAMVSSVFYGARLVHLPLAAAWAIQYATAALALAAVVWTYWQRRDPALSLALFVTATFLFTPYILNYDMVVFGFVVALLRERADNTMRDHWLLIAVWTLPVTMMFAGAIGVPLAPIVLIAFACWLLWRLAQGDGSEVRTLPEATVDALVATDDYSRTFATLRGKLISDNGERYVDFVRGLKSRYAIVYRDIAVGYVLLAVSFGLTVIAPAWGVPKLIAALLGACLVGYWVAYLQLFLHEGAHYNLAGTKDRSDRICDFAISWLIGTTIKVYRPVHFQHHRQLGTTSDTEFTYFFPLNLLFVVKAVFGIRAIEVLLFRRANTERTAAVAAKDKGDVLWLLAGVTVHAAIVAISVCLGWWWAALAWLLGMAMAFPFFGSLRQLLEHRDDAAPSTIDFQKQNHGAYTRLFGDDVFSATFGGAGFNRHLLHHWEPQVSYTNLPELEAFLQGTEIKRVMDLRRTTYFETFRRLWLNG